MTKHNCGLGTQVAELVRNSMTEDGVSLFRAQRFSVALEMNSAVSTSTDSNFHSCEGALAL